MRVNSLLAAKNFGVKQENIAVGNGAAELIKSLMSVTDGDIGIIRPTFEEYPNRYDEGKQVVFIPKNENFSYSAEDLIKFFDGKNIKSLILINPDNPTGNFIRTDGLRKIASWAESKKIRLILDESFSDFAAGENNSLITAEFIENYPTVCIVKSISKCYGVPGLRLGIVASGDNELISFIKQDVGIWNINSFAEFYMQIAEKYQKDYVNGLKQFKTERTRFKRKLDAIKKLRVIDSQANYFMVEVLSTSSGELVEKLLTNCNIFIKDLTGKIKDPYNKQYIRIAVRDRKDNDLLINALKEILGE